jgi:NADH-quinone oxidoreductase subunit G
MAFTAVADWVQTQAAADADIFLPVTAHVEMDGIYISYEGRAQRFSTVMTPGYPIKGLDPDRHPPRIFRTDPPGGDPRPSRHLIADLTERFGGEKVTPFAGRWKMLDNLDPGTGVKLTDELMGSAEYDLP